MADEMRQTVSEDPSRNVLRLVESEGKRQDDLRKAEIQRLDERITSNFESVKQINEDSIKRIEGLLKTYFDFDKQASEAESRRIDENRAIDNKAVSVAAGKAEAQAILLANNVGLLAETLRKSAEDTATKIVDRIALLERSQYENKGSLQGSTITTGKLFAGIAAISTIIGVIFLVGPKIFG